MVRRTILKALTDQVAPAAARRRTAPVTRSHRTSHGWLRPPPACTSRCTRFFAILGSGTLTKEMAGPAPPGSSMQAPSAHSSGGTPQCASHPAQLAKPPGGEASTYPSATLQKAASIAGRTQSNVTVHLVLIRPSHMRMQPTSSKADGPPGHPCAHPSGGQAREVRPARVCISSARAWLRRPDRPIRSPSRTKAARRAFSGP